MSVTFLVVQQAHGGETEGKEKVNKVGNGDRGGERGRSEECGRTDENSK